MGKALLPIFRDGISQIDSLLFYGSQDGCITYFHGSAPVFSHASSDENSFRMILSQFYVNGLTTQARLVTVFAINPLALKRWVKQFREEGAKSFFVTPSRKPRAPSKKKPCREQLART